MPHDGDPLHPATDGNPTGSAGNRGRGLSGPGIHERLVAPLALFACFYLATFWILGSLVPVFPWVALASGVCATAATISIWNGGRWDLGLAAERAGREFGSGVFVAVALIGSADLLIQAFTPLHHAAGPGFPFADTVLVFIPAVLHEELVFRGYPYQVLRLASRPMALVLSSVVFAAFHAGNDDVTPLALLNIFLGGVILTLAYENGRRLWMPIGLHFAWNMMSGPVLGYDVSGFTPRQSLLVTTQSGADLLTGGAFGIEGSAVMTALEAILILVLWRLVRPLPAAPV